MTYKVMAVGDDWVELWDGETIIDPDLPRHKSLDLFYIGEHSFQVDDIVDLMVRLVARITPPAEEVVPVADLDDAWAAEVDAMRGDRQVFDQHG